MIKNPFEKNVEELKMIAPQVRRDILRMVHAVNSGHPGGSLGCTEYFVSLYFKVLRHNPSFNMNGTGEDLFFSPTATSVRCGIVSLPVQATST